MRTSIPILAYLETRPWAGILQVQGRDVISVCPPCPPSPPPNDVLGPMPRSAAQNEEISFLLNTFKSSHAPAVMNLITLETIYTRSFHNTSK